MPFDFWMQTPGAPTLRTTALHTGDLKVDLLCFLLFSVIYALLLKLVPVFYVCTCEQKMCFFLMDMDLYDVKRGDILMWLCQVCSHGCEHRSPPPQPAFQIFCSGQNSCFRKLTKKGRETKVQTGIFMQNEHNRSTLNCVLQC